MNKIWKRFVGILLLLAAIVLICFHLSFRQPQDIDHVQIRRQIFAQAIADGESKENALVRVHDYNQSVRREYRNVTVSTTVGVELLAVLIFTLIRHGKPLASYATSLIPRSLRSKQLAIVLPVALWCSACCLFQALDPKGTQHSINAAVLALLLSAPALIFGAVSLWWVSQSKKID